ncbi:MAG: hypothetical protein WDW36_005541 [Sanguina aurantia]
MQQSRTSFFLSSAVARPVECVGTRTCATAVLVSAAEVQSDDHSMTDLLAVAYLMPQPSIGGNTGGSAAAAAVGQPQGARH